MYQEIFTTIVRSVFTLIKHGNQVQARTPFDHEVTLGLEKVRFGRIKYALTIGKRKTYGNPALLTHDFIAAVGIEASLKAILMALGLEDTEEFLIEARDGTVYPHSPASCGYCYYHIPHSLHMHESAKFIVMKSIFQTRFFKI